VTEAYTTLKYVSVIYIIENWYALGGARSASIYFVKVHRDSAMPNGIGIEKTGIGMLGPPSESPCVLTGW